MTKLTTCSQSIKLFLTDKKLV